MTLPATSVFVSAGKVSVAGCPTLRSAASASANPATTTSRCSESIVTKPDEDDVALPPPVGELDDEDDALEELWPATVTVDAPALTVEPTAPLTAVTVPAIGALSTVAATAFSSAATAAWACFTAASSWATVAAEGVPLAAIDASTWARLSSAALHRRLLVGDGLLGLGDCLRVLGAGARLGGNDLADADARAEGVPGDEPEGVGRIRLQPGHEGAHLALRGARASVDGSRLGPVVARRPVFEPVGGCGAVRVQRAGERHAGRRAIRRPSRSTPSARQPRSS